MVGVIFVDRSAVRMPSVLGPAENARGKQEFRAAREFYSQPEGKRRQKRFSFTIFRDQSVRNALLELFHGKCAYCESIISSTGPADIDQFRPKGGVVGQDGQHYPDHYWWLANEWSNLYPVCIDCNRPRRHRTPNGEVVTSGKGGRFPVRSESRRAPILGGPNELEAEDPLLLDPCGGSPESHLIFSDDGSVYSHDIRGQTTIHVLGLNRRGLIEARRLRAQEITEALSTMNRVMGQLSRHARDAQIPADQLERLKRFTRPDSAYAALGRQLLSDMLRRLETRTIENRGDIDAMLVQSHRDIKSAEHAAKTAFQTFQKEQADFSLEDETGLEKYHSRTWRIERIIIHNLKAIGSLTFDISASGGNAPWLMLLGDNATGKSTVLQALALALIGEKYFARLRSDIGLDLAGFVRDRCSNGEISVKISGISEPRRLKIFKNGHVDFRGRGAQTLVVGYGPTRLLPREKDKRTYGQSYARVENLFDPFIPLVDARNWLLSLPEDTFDYVARQLKGFLELKESDAFVRVGNRILLNTGRSRVPLERLCDGYQTVVALFADIMEIVLRQWPTPESAEGIVLLDEVGNHLHPTWKMRFVLGMREFLPGMQVIATTHEPLCLCGLVDGEIAVLKRGPRGGLSKISRLPSINGLRVDQLLTSEHFGLQSTVDPELQKIVDDYYALLRKRSPTERDKEKIEGLRDEINDRQRLGKTERERMLLEVIDKFLAERSASQTVAHRIELEKETSEQLATIWAEE